MLAVLGSPRREAHAVEAQQSGFGAHPQVSVGGLHHLRPQAAGEEPVLILHAAWAYCEMRRGSRAAAGEGCRHQTAPISHAAQRDRRTRPGASHERRVRRGLSRCRQALADDGWSSTLRTRMDGECAMSASRTREVYRTQPPWPGCDPPRGSAPTVLRTCAPAAPAEALRSVPTDRAPGLRGPGTRRTP